MPQLPQKPGFGGPFKRGAEFPSPEALNDIVKAVTRQIRGSGNASASYFGDRVIVGSEVTGQPQLPALSNYVSTFVVLQEFDDYLLCTSLQLTVDSKGNVQPFIYNPNLGIPPNNQTIQTVLVAKPYLLQLTPWDNQLVLYNDFTVIPATDRNLNMGFSTNIQSYSYNQYLTFASIDPAFEGARVAFFPYNFNTLMQAPTLAEGGDLTPGETYFYLIGGEFGPADNFGDQPQYSGTVAITTTNTKLSVVLTWQNTLLPSDVDVGEPNPLPNYVNIYRIALSDIDTDIGPDFSDPFALIAQIPSTAAGAIGTWTDTGADPALPTGPDLSAMVVPGTTYEDTETLYYCVVAQKADGTISAPSNIVEVDLTGTFTSPQDVSLTWTAFPGAVVYIILKSPVEDNFSNTPFDPETDEQFSPAFIAALPSDTLSYTDTGGQPGTNVMTGIGAAAITQTITPGYFPGDIIKALPLATGYKDPSTGRDVLWMDINEAARTWQGTPFLSTGNYSGGTFDFTNINPFLFFDNDTGIQLGGDSPGLSGLVNLIPASKTAWGVITTSNQAFNGTKMFVQPVIFGGGDIVEGTPIGVGAKAYSLSTNDSDVGQGPSPGDFFLSQHFDLYPTLLDSGIRVPFVFWAITDAGGNSQGVGWGLAAGYFGLQMSLLTPFTADNPALCFGTIAGATLFTGVDSNGVHYCCGLRLA